MLMYCLRCTSVCYHYVILFELSLCFEWMLIFATVLLLWMIAGMGRADDRFRGHVDVCMSLSFFL